MNQQEWEGKNFVRRGKWSYLKAEKRKKMASTNGESSGSKIVEKLVISTVRPKVRNSQTKPENEQINTAVLKVLEGYDWTLVQAPVK